MFERLIGHRHDIAAHFERVGAHFHMRQFGLHNHFGMARIGHVDAGKVFRRAFMRQPHDAAAVTGFLDRHAFADPAPAVQQVVCDQFHAIGFKCGHCIPPNVYSACHAARMIYG